MFDLMQALMARELNADRVRQAQQYRLRRDTRRASESHRRQVERVRASVLLVPRTRSSDSQEA